MPTILTVETIEILRRLISEPLLAHARELEIHLTNKGFERKVFGRLNQKSSIDAASESDRGITERLSNAFDASLTAARTTLTKLLNSQTTILRPAAKGCEEEYDFKFRLIN
jgi:hypothetical protein